jgi:hypothetical protein
MLHYLHWLDSTSWLNMDFHKDMEGSSESYLKVLFHNFLSTIQ